MMPGKFHTLSAPARTNVMSVMLALAATVIVFIFGYHFERERVTERELRNLNLIHELRRAAIEDHFVSVTSDVLSMSRSTQMRENFDRMAAVWIKLGKYAPDVLRNRFGLGDKKLTAIDLLDFGWVISDYAEPYRELEVRSQSVIDYFDLHDIFLVDPAGNVLFSYAKEDDFATNLIEGPYAATPLGYVFDRAMAAHGKVAVSYVERYRPSDDLPAVFVAVTIPDINGRPVGVLGVQLELNAVNEIARAPAELIGDLNVAVLDSNFLVVAGNVPGGSVESLQTTYINSATKRGFAGFSGSQVIKDASGGERMAVYSPLIFGSKGWIIVSEMGMDNFVRKIQLEMLIFIAAFGGLLVGLVVHALIVAFRREAPIVD